MNIYIVITMIVTLIAKIIGFGREVLLSFCFGTSNISDAYLISLTIPGLIFQFVGTGLSTSFIPIYLKYSKKKDSKVIINKFINTIISFILIFSLILCLIVWLFGEQVVKLFASGFSEETLKVTVLFTKINITSLFIATFVYVFISILQSKGKVLETQISVIPYGIITLISIVIGAKFNIIALPIGSVIASIMQLLILLFYISREKLKIRFKFELDTKSKAFMDFMKVIGPVIIGVSINDINILVDKAMASNIMVGAISALSYSYSLTMFIQGVFVQPIINIYYPKITLLITEKSRNLKKVINEGLNCIFYFLFPIIGYCLISANNIISILYGRGAFDINAISLTTSAFLGYSISYIGIAAREFFSRIFYAYNNTKTPTINAFIGGIINIFLNITLSKFLGIFGLALATSLSAIVTTLLLYRSLVKEKIYYLDKSMFIQIIKIIGASLAMLFTILFIRNISKLDSKLLMLILEIIVGGTVYLIFTLKLKVEIVISLKGNISKKIQKKFKEEL